MTNTLDRPQDRQTDRIIMPIGHTTGMRSADGTRSTGAGRTADVLGAMGARCDPLPQARPGPDVICLTIDERDWGSGRNRGPLS